MMIVEGNRYYQLREQGWGKQSILDEPRLSECADLYRVLGFEVLVEPLRPEYLEGECGECLFAEPGRYWVIFTKTKERREADGGN